MTENAKTLSFVGVGFAAVVVALLTQPSSADLDAKSQRGEVLTKKFQSPDQAKRLRIVRVDEKTATRSTFDVAEKNGLWTMPSKDGYPADGTKQMAEAATGLMDLKILDVTSENAGDHSQFGVIDPLGDVDVGQTGLGTRVTVSDAQDQPLADLIIGNEVKDLPGKRYVRVADQPLVYVLEIDPSRLSTKFEDWIEKDLLKLSTVDIQQVNIKDYSAELVPVLTDRGVVGQITWDPRGEYKLAYDDSGAKWSPLELRSYNKDKRDYEEFKLTDDEELDATKLNAMKTALDDLKIVDVVRKPQGLSEDLKAGDDFTKNPEAQRDLIRRGFTPTPGQAGGAPELISSDGEEIITLKNGTEYILRFGKLVQVDEEQPAGGAAADPAKADAKSGVHRYLFAMARFNEGAVKKPELQDLPELPIGSEFRPAAGAENAAGENKAADPKEGDKQQDPPPQVTEQAAAGAQAADTKGEAAANKEQTEKETALSRAIADRKRIEAENQHKLEEYQATLEKGRENVKNLNLRFGDWYFVVDNEVFNKIRLGRDSVIKQKEKKADADTKKADESVLGAPGSLIEGIPNLLRGQGDKSK